VERGTDMIEVLDPRKVKRTENLWTSGSDLEHGTLLARYLIDGDPRRVIRANDAARLGFASGKIGSARTGYLTMIERVRNIARKAEQLIDTHI
jgi:hypothetical protein